MLNPRYLSTPVYRWRRFFHRGHFIMHSRMDGIFRPGWVFDWQGIGRERWVWVRRGSYMTRGLCGMNILLEVCWILGRGWNRTRERNWIDVNSWYAPVPIFTDFIFNLVYADTYNPRMCWFVHDGTTRPPNERDASYVNAFPNLKAGLEKSGH